MKDIHGYATQSDLGGVPIILVYSNVKQAELLAEITGGGKAVPVLVTDNSRLAQLRIALEEFDNAVKGWEDPIGTPAYLIRRELMNKIQVEAGREEVKDV